MIAFRHALYGGVEYELGDGVVWLAAFDKLVDASNGYGLKVVGAADADGPCNEVPGKKRATIAGNMMKIGRSLLCN